MTAAILDVQQNIRRALEGVIFLAAQAAPILLADGRPAVKFGTGDFDRVVEAKKLNVDALEYFTVDIAVDQVVVRETGKTPMVEANGHVSVSCRSAGKMGRDRNDALARIVASAYPYASTPSFGGVSVFIDKATHRGYGEDGPYLTGLINVNWNIYRRP